ncbi:hypothetical protein NLM24_22500 [Nocardia zapadnayensis]|uniref:hypothetical protein n=1 Tax=Nocardia rhamnosiphila TaxID=426716 RepID=UPI002245D2A1|nr:hypothetical protein [Nocardia zapadnayensis]MCX0273412.1 hypothetical protein [Nocardia zapadnayensis]
MVIMIVITTPTGAIGSRLLGILLERAPSRGEDLRVIVRDPAKLAGPVRDRVDPGGRRALEFSTALLATTGGQRRARRSAITGRCGPDRPPGGLAPGGVHGRSK